MATPNYFASALTRDEDCLAAEICHKIGNLRKCCVKGGMHSKDESDICIKSVILLLARQTGLISDFPPPDEDIRPIGFHRD